VTTVCKNWKSVKWYDGIVWNLATIIQILLGECMLNFVQYGACLHLSVQNVWGAHFFSGHTVYKYIHTFSPNWSPGTLNIQSLLNPVLVSSDIKPRIQTSSVVSLVDGRIRSSIRQTDMSAVAVTRIILDGSAYTCPHCALPSHFLMHAV